MKMQKDEMKNYRNGSSIDFFKRLGSNGYEYGGIKQWFKRMQRQSSYKEDWEIYLSLRERVMEMRWLERGLKEGLRKFKLGYFRG